ncbi:hypothetical protein OHT57_12745 [Streptomyces sp. NBC_00285]|uniref:hypothetical protein n=1 Tax=Streptomyces sp. NBC_00285 TaxID=2975700 RepID=UPI002E2D53FF|nr:hypothetical protein [Streptomyces sp. NBC_00285]
MADNEEAYEWVEGGTLWLRPAPGESVADFVKRAARARGPLTDAEKVALRDVFAPVLDQPHSEAA